MNSTLGSVVPLAMFTQSPSFALSRALILYPRDMMSSKEAQEKTKKMGEALGIVPASNRK